MDNNFNQDGHIRLRDKRHEADPSAIDKYRRKHKKAGNHIEGGIQFKGEYGLRRRERLEYHAQRIEAEERMLMEHGIDPHRAGSAVKFDKLILTQITSPQICPRCFQAKTGSGDVNKTYAGVGKAQR